MTDRNIDYIPLDQVIPADRNPKGHADSQIRDSMRRFGFTTAGLLDERTGKLVEGHGRLDALKYLRDQGEAVPEGIGHAPDGTWLVPVQTGWASRDDREAEAYLVASNRLTMLGDWDNPELLALLDMQDDLTGTGFTDEDISALMALVDDTPPDDPQPTLADRFLVPPFSVLDARQGYWTERKNQWLSLGIRSEVGRSAEVYHVADDHPGGGRGGTRASGDGAALGLSASGRDPRFYAKKGIVEARLGRKLTTQEFQDKYYVGQDPGTATAIGSSIFDPVLCEVVYRWFSRPNHHVLDPFAGGSVRGVVAGLLDREYHGVELRSEQVEANQAQVAQLLPDPDMVTYTQGDSAQVLQYLTKCSYDLVFTCPPYYDLETYSQDPADISAMSPADFDRVYSRILDLSVNLLKDDGYAVIVTGNVRDSRGYLRDLRALTVDAMTRAGASFLNDAILVTKTGSLPVRAARQFQASRLLGRTHQEVLIFCKGDRKTAAANLGEVEVSDEWTEAAADQQE